MTHLSPAADCHELVFPQAGRLDASAQVALEDYAQVITGARSAAVVEGGDGLVTGVHLCGLGAPPTAEVEQDVRAFAYELQAAKRGTGLGWS
jgi:hypothetical protein